MSGDKDNFNLADLTASLKDEDRAGLMNALKNKLMAGQRSDVLESLTPLVRNRVEALRDIQGKHDELEAKFREERAVLEAKYEKLYQPLYTKRYEIVNGVTDVEPTPEDTKMDQGEEKTAEEKGVPSFWLTALKNNDVTSEEVTERDEEALKYLKDIKWCKTEEPKGFKLEFFFDSNPYFKNAVLTKSYHMIDEDDPLLEKAIGTDIDWYPGKCLTQKILKKKPKKGSNAKPITKMEDCESFFNFFNPPQVPEEDEDIDEDSAEELQNLMEQDYDIGSAIREKIIPHAVSWFTGEAMDGEEFDLDDDDEDDDIDEDEDEDEEDDEEDEEDDEDEEDSKTKKKPSSGRKKGGRSQVVVGDGQQGERPPECKQQ
ncbi:nucleosome assembly protein 1;1 [Raphanus sativus]|uniref:Nucleosome assembly protein 11 n=1 Tax=Raphanus sativus TaxID=3726 RepID=A0A6J0ME58_RAPSA|nr:nucleosome assembly protein 1;1 [Raphanus sativus]